MESPRRESPNCRTGADMARRKAVRKNRSVVTTLGGAGFDVRGLAAGVGVTAIPP